MNNRTASSQGPWYWLPLLVGALAIAGCGGWLRLSIEPPFGRDLYPGPDALEYAEMARRFAYLEGFGLEVSGAAVPSRYPALFPLLLAPLARMIGGQSVYYPVMMTLLGSISIGLAASLGTLVSGMRRTGLLVAALLALSVSHILASHLVMSDLLMLMFYQAAFVLALLHRRVSCSAVWETGSSVLLAGLLAGSLAAVRTPGAMLGIAFGLYYLFLILCRLRKSTGNGCSYYRGLWLAVLYISGAIIPVGFELLSRSVQFGSPFADPYAYYVPSFRPGSGFRPIALEWITKTEGQRVPNWKYFGNIFLGTDEAHQGFRMPWNGTPVLAGLALFIFSSLRRRDAGVLLLLVAAPAALLLLHMTYYWQESRLVLVPIFVALFLVSNLLTVLCEWLNQLLQRMKRTSALARYTSLSVFCLAGSALLYLQREPVRIALHPMVETSGLTEELRGQVQQSLERLPRQAVLPIVITNAGTLKVRNLLFPGPSSQAPLVISLTDSFAHDEHVFRTTRQTPHGIPEGHAIGKPLCVLSWQFADRSGSGPLTPQMNVLETLRLHSGKSHVLILLKQPDQEALRALQVWYEHGGWSIRERAHFPGYRLLEAKPLNAIR